LLAVVVTGRGVEIETSGTATVIAITALAGVTHIQVMREGENEREVATETTQARGPSSQTVETEIVGETTEISRIAGTMKKGDVAIAETSEAGAVEKEEDRVQAGVAVEVEAEMTVVSVVAIFTVVIIAVEQMVAGHDRHLLPLLLPPRRLLLRHRGRVLYRARGGIVGDPVRGRLRDAGTMVLGIDAVGEMSVEVAVAVETIGEELAAGAAAVVAGVDLEAVRAEVEAIDNDEEEATVVEAVAPAAVVIS
jgi:hypothetical protein